MVWRSFLDATSGLQRALEVQLQADSDMPHAYYELLVRLSESPDHQLRMSALARGTGWSRSRLSHAVDKLAELDWVRRAECPTDKRGQYALLTGTGLKALELAAPGHVEKVQEVLFDRLTPSQARQLGEICRTLLAGLDR